MATKNDKKKGSPSMTEYMMKRAAMGSVNAPKPKPEATTNVYRMGPPSQGYQDSAAIFSKTGLPQFKPKGPGYSKTFEKTVPTKTIKTKK
jgi:hypothetical protein